MSRIRLAIILIAFLGGSGCSVLGQIEETLVPSPTPAPTTPLPSEANPGEQDGESGEDGSISQSDSTPLSEIEATNGVGTPDPDKEATSTPLPQLFPELVCAADQPTNLAPGMVAIVNPNPPIPNRVRAAPGLSSSMLGQVQPSEQLAVLDGPRCADGFSWWLIESLQSGLSGWTMEGVPGEDWVIPLFEVSDLVDIEDISTWYEYTNLEYDFSFKYPNMTICCELEGPTTGDWENIITLVVPSTLNTGRESDLEAVAIHLVHEITPEGFMAYLAQEKAAFDQIYLASAGVAPDRDGQEVQLEIGGQNAVHLVNYLADGLDRYYISLPAGQDILVISVKRGSDGVFDAIFDEILASFEFE